MSAAAILRRLARMPYLLRRDLIVAHEMQQDRAFYGDETVDAAMKLAEISPLSYKQAREQITSDAMTLAAASGVGLSEALDTVLQLAEKGLRP